MENPTVPQFFIVNSGIGIPEVDPKIDKLRFSDVEYIKEVRRAKFIAYTNIASQIENDKAYFERVVKLLKTLTLIDKRTLVVVSYGNTKNYSGALQSIFTDVNVAFDLNFDKNVIVVCEIKYLKNLNNIDNKFDNIINVSPYIYHESRAMFTLYFLVKNNGKFYQIMHNQTNSMCKRAMEDIRSNLWMNSLFGMNSEENPDIEVLNAKLQWLNLPVDN